MEKDMAGQETSMIWVPTCCGVTMRHNIFREREGAGHGTLVCPNCGKHINLEPEPVGSLNEFGGGVTLLSVVAAQRPPKTARRAAAPNQQIDDQTL